MDYLRRNFSTLAFWATLALALHQLLNSLVFAVRYHAVRLDIGVQELGVEGWETFVQHLPGWVVAVLYALWFSILGGAIALILRRAEAVLLFGLALLCRFVLFVRPNPEFEHATNTGEIVIEFMRLIWFGSVVGLILLLWLRGQLPNGYPRRR